MNNIHYDTQIKLSELQANLLGIPEEMREINKSSCMVQRDVIQLYIKQYAGDFFSLVDKKSDRKREPSENQHHDFLLLLIHSGHFTLDQRLGSANGYKSMLDYALQHHWDRVFDALIECIPNNAAILLASDHYDGDTPLEVVIKQKDMKKAKSIIGKMGGNVLYPGCSGGYSALGCAVRHNNGEIAALLLEKGAYEFGQHNHCLPGETLAESWDILKKLIIRTCSEKRWKNIMSAYPNLDKLVEQVGFGCVCKLLSVKKSDPATVLNLFAQHLSCRIYHEIANLDMRDTLLSSLNQSKDIQSLATAIINAQSMLLRETQHFWQRKADIKEHLPPEIVDILAIKQLLSNHVGAGRNANPLHRRATDRAHKHSHQHRQY